MKAYTIVLISLMTICLAGCSMQDSAAKIMPSETPYLTAGLQTVSGVVLGGGDQTPPGLMDAPRTFIYQLRLESGEEINIAYTAYPYSPAAESRPVIRLTVHGGEIKPGDYLTAQGTYDPATKTLTVSAEGDFIETSPNQP